MAGAAEEAAFVEFATARAPGLFRSALLLTGEWHAAEDLVQETLGQVFARWTRVTRADNPAAYARAMQVNRFLSDQRRRSAHSPPRLGEVEGCAGNLHVAQSLVPAAKR